MKMTTKQLTLCAVLAALALALSYIERLFPVPLPLPGFKLGLANIVTVYALYALGAAPALAILLVRVLLGAMFAGNASALMYSLLGGLAALGAMAALSRWD
ncbi:MAG: Gx transporter family protein, partial [Oscillospiraceae bacterium]|nr:Gx transporter family protein [Oscillospiraceae bacterium]